MHGLHILAELHECACPRELLHNTERLRACCREACERAGLTIVADAFHAFGTMSAPAGATGAVVLAESHLAVHTWPEIGSSGAVTLDLYVCNFSRDNGAAAQLAYDYLVNSFSPRRVNRHDVIRGAIDGNRNTLI